MTAPEPITAALLVAAYVLGCVNAGYYLVRWKTGRDVRATGSGGTGATNVGRQLGKSGFAVTLLVDGLKGAAGVMLARGAGLTDEWCLLTLAAVVAGHVWPAQLRFRGGKGVAPYLGGLLIYDLVSLLVVGGILGLLWLPWRRFSLAGLAAFSLLPLAAWCRGHAPEVIGALVLNGLLILVAHRGNIRKEIAERSSGTPSATGLAMGTPNATPTNEHGTTDRV